MFGWFARHVIACAVLLLIAVPARPQGTSTEIAGGYNFLRLSDAGLALPGKNLPVGWYADISAKVTNIFAVVGQVDGNYKTFRLGGNLSGISVDTKVHGFMGGVRLNGGTNANVVPFGQVLFGAMHMTRAVSGSAGLGPFNTLDSETDAALQVGGGVNVGSGNVGVRFGLDYLRVFAADVGVNGLRFAAGVAYGFGKR